MGRKRKYTERQVKNIYNNKTYWAIDETDNTVKVEDKEKNYYVMAKADVLIVERGSK